LGPTSNAVNLIAPHYRNDVTMCGASAAGIRLQK
jgi:hypothetical protein